MQLRLQCVYGPNTLVTAHRKRGNGYTLYRHQNRGTVFITVQVAWRQQRVTQPVSGP